MIKFAISTSGSGQMQPLPMNELVQENLNAVGFDVEFEVDGLERAGHVRLPAGAGDASTSADINGDQHQPRHGRSLLRPSCALYHSEHGAAERRQLGPSCRIPSWTS